MFRASDFSNVLVSVGGILIMSEIDSVFGFAFKIHLETYYLEEILEQQNFMEFKCTKKQKELSYLWIMTLFSINFLGAFFLSAYMGSTVCPNFDDFLKQYLNGALYNKGKFWLFMSFLLNILYIFWTLIPFASIRLLDELLDKETDFYEEGEQDIEEVKKELLNT